MSAPTWKRHAAAANISRNVDQVVQLPPLRIVLCETCQFAALIIDGVLQPPFEVDVIEGLVTPHDKSCTARPRLGQGIYP